MGHHPGRGRLPVRTHQRRRTPFILLHIVIRARIDRKERQSVHNQRLVHMVRVGRSRPAHGAGTTRFRYHHIPGSHRRIPGCAAPFRQILPNRVHEHRLASDALQHRRHPRLRSTHDRRVRFSPIQHGNSAGDHHRSWRPPHRFDTGSREQTLRRASSWPQSVPP